MKLDKTLVTYRQSMCSQYMARATGILHLGAHLGMEAPTYAEHGKPVLWVEAMPDIFAKLQDRLTTFPSQRALCALLGDKDGQETTFKVSNNAGGASSSIFDFGAYGGGEKTLWPELGLRMVDQITLPMTRLDTLLAQAAIDPAGYDYWVVDLQGAEKLALEGGPDALRACNALLVEVSTAEVYQQGVLWPELAAWLQEQGFIPLWQPAMQHDDILFIRNTEKDKVTETFRADAYVRHNQRRLEHLASLGLDLHNKRVLEVGAGIGDHTGFYLDRGCSVMTSDARPENLMALQERFAGNPAVRIASLDMDQPAGLTETFDVVHCYGLLYHLQKPGVAIEFLCKRCDSLLVLETCVSYGSEARMYPLAEPAHELSQAFSGQGCRPTRAWVVEQLKRFMPHVYVTATQPAHPEFPLDWSVTENDLRQLKRAVFVASRVPLGDNPMLCASLPLQQSHLAPITAQMGELRAANDLLRTQVIDLEAALKQQSRSPAAGRRYRTPLSKLSASERVKRHLSYRLGSTMIAHSRSIWGCITMPFALAGQVIAFRRDQRAAQGEEQPHLSSYSDAQAALQVKQHLSYRLGSVMLQHSRSLGGWLALPRALRQEVRDFRLGKAPKQ
jgi:FkbM family methyltransferase